LAKADDTLAAASAEADDSPAGALAKADALPLAANTSAQIASADEIRNTPRAFIS
jgi:hypothetical protein